MEKPVTSWKLPAGTKKTPARELTLAAKATAPFCNRMTDKVRTAFIFWINFELLLSSYLEKERNSN